MAIFLPTNILNHRFQSRPTVETNVPNRSLFTLSLPLHLGVPGWPSKSVGIGSVLCSCLLMWPFTHLQVLVDMDGNTNDPSWAPLLSCFKPGDIFAVSFSCSNVQEKVEPGFLTTSGFHGIYDPFPQQLSPQSLALLPPARISRHGKQTNYGETNTTVNSHVVKWRECIPWERM